MTTLRLSGTTLYSLVLRLTPLDTSLSLDEKVSLPSLEHLSFRGDAPSALAIVGQVSMPLLRLVSVRVGIPGPHRIEAEVADSLLHAVGTSCRDRAQLSLLIRCVYSASATLGQSCRHDLASFCEFERGYDVVVDRGEGCWGWQGRIAAVRGEHGVFAMGR